MTACAREGCGHDWQNHGRFTCVAWGCSCHAYQPAPTSTADDARDVAAWVEAIDSGALDSEEIAEDLVVLSKMIRERAAAPSLGERIALAIEAVEPSGLMSASHETAYLAGLIAAARIARETT